MYLWCGLSFHKYQLSFKFRINCSHLHFWGDYFYIFLYPAGYLQPLCRSQKLPLHCGRCSVEFLDDPNEMRVPTKAMEPPTRLEKVHIVQLRATVYFPPAPSKWKHGRGPGCGQPIPGLAGSLAVCIAAPLITNRWNIRREMVSMSWGLTLAEA